MIIMILEKRIANVSCAADVLSVSCLLALGTLDLWKYLYSCTSTSSEIRLFYATIPLHLSIITVAHIAHSHSNMMILAHSSFLAAVLYSNLIFAQNNSSCYGSDDIDAWRSPNASSSYIIPAVIQSNSSEGQTTRASNDSTHYWDVTDNVVQTTDPWTVSPSTEILHGLFLDTQYSNAPIEASQAGCAFIFTLPKSKQDKHSADGNCSTLISNDCVEAITTNSSNLAVSIAGSKDMSMNKACDALAQSLFHLPDSCPKGTTEGLSVRSWQSK